MFIDSPENNGVPDNQGDSYSAFTKRQLPKKFKKSKEDETMDEALQVLRKSNNQKQEDSFDIFGKHSANEIRSLDNANAQRWVKFKMQEIIFQVQLKPNVQTNSNLASFTTPQRAPQNDGYLAFPHPVQLFADNTSLRERQMYESPRSPHSPLGSGPASNLEMTE